MKCLPPTFSKTQSRLVSSGAQIADDGRVSEVGRVLTLTSDTVSTFSGADVVPFDNILRAATE